MIDVDVAVAAMCGAPGGCAFLLTVEAYKLAPEGAVDPATTIHLVAEALSELSPWSPEHDRMVAASIEEGPRLVSLARSILARPEVGWWFGPVDRASQEWISRSGQPPDQSQLTTPTGPPTDWERFAQKPAAGLFTSTGVNGTSSALALLAHGNGDYVVEPPVVRYRLLPSKEARVLEIDGPHAWYRLCERYPAQGEDGRLVPDWSNTALEWDGVHLTLGGLLTAEQVRVDGRRGWAEHAFWDAEQTIWLRWAFDELTRLPDLERLTKPITGGGSSR